MKPGRILKMYLMYIQQIRRLMAQIDLVKIINLIENYLISDNDYFIY